MDSLSSSDEDNKSIDENEDASPPNTVTSVLNGISLITKADKLKLLKNCQLEGKAYLNNFDKGREEIEIFYGSTY
jgi:hypothetical protein